MKKILLSIVTLGIYLIISKMKNKSSAPPAHVNSVAPNPAEHATPISAPEPSLSTETPVSEPEVAVEVPTIPIPEPEPISVPEEPELAQSPAPETTPTTTPESTTEETNQPTPPPAV